MAEGKGDDKAVGRIQKLIDREQGRYDKKHKKMTECGLKDKAEKTAEADDDDKDNDDDGDDDGDKDDDKDKDKDDD